MRYVVGGRHGLVRFSPVDSGIGPWNRSPAHVGGWNEQRPESHGRHAHARPCRGWNISIDNTRNRGNHWFEMKWRHPADGKRNHREGLALSSMRVIHEQRDSHDGVMRDYHLVLLTTCVLSCNRYSL